MSGELSLAVDLGQVAEPASGNAEFSLAFDLGRVAEPVPWKAEFLLAVWDPIPDDPGCLSLRLRGSSFLGSNKSHLVAAYFLKAKRRLGHQGIECKVARGQGPNLDDFPKVVRAQLLLLLLLSLL